MGLLAWLKKTVGAGSEGPALSVPTPGYYLAADQSPCPTAAGAAYRVEEHQRPALTERRQYNLLDGPEWLVEVLETGHDAAGQPLHRRTWYYPWGQISKQIMRCGEVLSYQTYFENGDLKLSKRAEAGRLTERFAYAPERGSTYLYVEKMPKYPGGDNNQLIRDIQRAFKYPAQALRNREEGRLIVSFVVTRTGRVADIQVKQSVSPSIDEAGIRAVSSIGVRRWRPGFQNYRAVEVSYNVPITCKVQ
jgi:TonB family protein